MAITKYPPRTILLGGSDGAPATIINDLAAGESIQPGALVERFQRSAGVAAFRKHTTASGQTSKAVAIDAHMLNRGVNTPWGSGELIEVGILKQGDTAWMLIASGAALVKAGDGLESAGNGMLRAGAGAGRMFTAIEDTDNSTGMLGNPGHIKVEAI